MEVGGVSLPPHAVEYRNVTVKTVYDPNRDGERQYELTSDRGEFVVLLFCNPSPILNQGEHIGSLYFVPRGIETAEGYDYLKARCDRFIVSRAF
jgi:hypothetical protein